jgi:riboflavin synthase alpha subunit
MSLDFEAGDETLSKTNLGRFKVGSRVNLERSLAANARLGGHFVQGHVDGVATVSEIVRNGDWIDMWFTPTADQLRLLVPKGSVAIDGISLTVVNVTADRFSVALIPAHIAVTTLGSVASGDVVNIENDILGKYVDQLLERRLADGSLSLSPQTIASIAIAAESRKSAAPMKNVQRQTRSWLMELFTQHGFNPRGDLGQNFLIDVNLIEFAVRHASLGPNDVALEVGSGTGGMTAFLAEEAGHVISVDVDENMSKLGRRSCGRLQQRHADQPGHPEEQEYTCTRNLRSDTSPRGVAEEWSVETGGQSAIQRCDARDCQSDRLRSALGTHGLYDSMGTGRKDGGGTRHAGILRAVGVDSVTGQHSDFAEAGPECVLAATQSGFGDCEYLARQRSGGTDQ